jgi:hypothetical protein
MGNELSTLLITDANHFLGDAGTGNRGTEKVSSLVNSITLNELENIFLDEFLAEIGDNALGGSDSDGLGLDSFEIFFELTDVGAEANNFKALLAQPFEDDGSVKTSRIGKDQLGLSFAHCYIVGVRLISTTTNYIL